MVLIKNAKATQGSWKQKVVKLTGQLLLSSACWYLWQLPSPAQVASPSGLDPAPGELPPGDSPEALEFSEPSATSDDTADQDESLWEDADESDVPTVELLEQRPSLEDLDPRINESSAADANDSNFDQYRLGPGDGIFVSVQRFPDLAFQATLDQQGNVIVPIEGTVPLEGLTLSEAENRIRAVYNQYVVLAEIRSLYASNRGLISQIEGRSYREAEDVINSLPNYQLLRANNPQAYRVPDVTMALTAQRGVEVIMLGEIERPGLYPLAVPRVTAALLAAGGASNTADLREIRIQRRLATGEVIEKTVDLYTPVRDGVPLPEERLENGDVVIISRLDPAQSYDYDVNLVSRSTLAQPEILVRLINYPSGVAGGQRLPNGSTFVDALVGDAVRGGNGIGLPLNQANLRSVALIRFDPEQGKAVVTKLNAKDAIYGDPTQNPPLRDNDVIVVGRNFINRITFAIDTITQPFQDALSFILFFDGIVNGDFFD
ncbi:polysaccharide biosynthesis/export family protein [Leptothoe sp. PORK10 BA2]|uniref:polysaccharide biosynthesis/export family protein n=1 Tax=Leptothoe sp. PORK10 BA2 TaxID=3110254 RepID=UPI002B1F0B58|nr:polysaccharide biosynthesis/export family protein [Leptothoe sp. PORK10 BA2]MEA5462236.1 polysaccharide biosynthesis/export family protein [Leptothoe sp. PORK10 BA2]